MAEHPHPQVSIVHDYLTQRGGAERVVLVMAEAFPGASIHTALFDQHGTFPAFAEAEIISSPLNRISPLRHHHRLALPLLAPTFSAMRVQAQVVVCSSSGWAHGARTSGRKVTYFHTPARWLYQADRYLSHRRGLTAAGLALLTPALRRWDRAAVLSTDRALCNSTAVRQRLEACYGIRAEVVPPPHDVDPAGPRAPLPGLQPGFALCVSRLLPYKNVGPVIEAFAALPSAQLVVAGSGPQHRSLVAKASRNAVLVGEVADNQLAWLYANCSLLIAASYEDFGLTPVEAAAFGKPAAVLRWGGFLDTVVENETGLFFDRPEPGLIAAAVGRASTWGWDPHLLRQHAERFSKGRFITDLRRIVSEEAVLSRV